MGSYGAQRAPVRQTEAEPLPPVLAALFDAGDSDGAKRGVPASERHSRSRTDSVVDTDLDSVIGATEDGSAFWGRRPTQGSLESAEDGVNDLSASYFLSSCEATFPDPTAGRTRHSYAANEDDFDFAILLRQSKAQRRAFLAEQARKRAEREARQGRHGGNVAGGGGVTTPLGRAVAAVLSLLASLLLPLRRRVRPCLRCCGPGQRYKRRREHALDLARARWYLASREGEGPDEPEPEPSAEWAGAGDGAGSGDSEVAGDDLALGKDGQDPSLGAVAASPDHPWADENASPAPHRSNADAGGEGDATPKALTLAPRTAGTSGPARPMGGPTQPRVYARAPLQPVTPGRASGKKGLVKRMHGSPPAHDSPRTPLSAVRRQDQALSTPDRSPVVAATARSGGRQAHTPATPRTRHEAAHSTPPPHNTGGAGGVGGVGGGGARDAVLAHSPPSPAVLSQSGSRADLEFQRVRPAVANRAERRRDRQRAMAVAASSSSAPTTYTDHTPSAAVDGVVLEPFASEAAGDSGTGTSPRRRRQEEGGGGGGGTGGDGTRTPATGEDADPTHFTEAGRALLSLFPSTGQAPRRRRRRQGGQGARGGGGAPATVAEVRAAQRALRYSAGSGASPPGHATAGRRGAGGRCLDGERGRVRVSAGSTSDSIYSSGQSPRGEGDREGGGKDAGSSGDEGEDEDEEDDEDEIAHYALLRALDEMVGTGGDVLDSGEEDEGEGDEEVQGEERERGRDEEESVPGPGVPASAAAGDGVGTTDGREPLGGEVDVEHGYGGSQDQCGPRALRSPSPRPRPRPHGAGGGDDHPAPDAGHRAGRALKLRQARAMARRAAAHGDPVAVLLLRLRQAGLESKRVRSAVEGREMIKVKAPEGLLTQWAERLGTKLRRKGGGFAAYTAARHHDFAPSRSGSVFTSATRQRIVDAILRTRGKDGGAGISDDSPLSNAVDCVYPLHAYQRLEELRWNWVYFWRVPPRGARLPGSACDALPKRGRCLSLRRWWHGAFSQPLDEVNEYFGEGVAFYFAWVEFYSRWLVFPSIVGAILFTIQLTSQEIDHPVIPLYALFMAAWSALFLVCWRRRTAALAYKWGVLNHEADERPRPQFRGELRQEASTGDWELHYPSWRRALTRMGTLPTLAMVVAGLVSLMLFLFITRDAIVVDEFVRPEVEAAGGGGANATASSSSSSSPSGSGSTFSPSDASLATLDSINYASTRFWFYMLMPAILYGCLIPLLDWLFTRVAHVFNDLENYRTESSYRNHLILKVFLFRFVNCFLSLYYYAFNKQHGILQLSVQLASFLIAGQVWNNVVEAGIPNALLKRRKAQRRRALARVMADPTLSRRHRDRLAASKSAVWDEATMMPYDTFDDYTEMMIQFGYVTFFSLAWPLAPLFALINNVVEIRTDAFRLCYLSQRPVAHRAGGIGVWFNVLQSMSVLAIMTNCAHIGFTSRHITTYFPGITEGQKVFAVFMFEHAVLLLDWAITLAVPPVSTKLRETMRRQEAQRRRCVSASHHDASLRKLPVDGKPLAIAAGARARVVR